MEQVDRICFICDREEAEENLITIRRVGEKIWQYACPECIIASLNMKEITEYDDLLLKGKVI